MATKAYGNPALWRALDVANMARRGLDRVREIKAGVESYIPDPRHPLAIVEKVTAFSPDTVALLREGQKVHAEGLEKTLRPNVGVLG